VKRRARRVTIAAAVLGAGVVAVLVVAHWATVRDHVEASWFQLTRETETIELPRGLRVSLRVETGILQLLADTSGCAVIRERADSFFERSIHVDWSVWVRETRPEMCLRLLRENGYRVIEQRFPRSAYVVIRDEP
jgi:hypothetical protein